MYICSLQFLTVIYIIRVPYMCSTRYSTYNSYSTCRCTVCYLCRFIISYLNQTAIDQSSGSLTQLNKNDIGGPGSNFLLCRFTYKYKIDGCASLHEIDKGPTVHRVWTVQHQHQYHYSREYSRSVPLYYSTSKVMSDITINQNPVWNAGIYCTSLRPTYMYVHTAVPTIQYYSYRPWRIIINVLKWNKQCN